jgi:hypothetical protein
MSQLTSLKICTYAILPLAMFYGIAITPLAYQEARHRVIDWAMNQPEMDVIAQNNILQQEHDNIKTLEEAMPPILPLRKK